MKKISTGAVWLIAGLMATSVWANKGGVSAHLADESARLGIYSEAEWNAEIYRFDATYQYTTNKDYVIDASILYTNKGSLDPNLDLGFKSKAAIAMIDQPSSETYGIMLGVYGRYWLPTPVPSALVADVVFSPKIITFGDGDAMRDTNLRFQIQLLRNLNGFIGYRAFAIDFDGANSYDVDRAVNIGFELGFN